jgi:hypothetical protein
VNKPQWCSKLNTRQAFLRLQIMTVADLLDGKLPKLPQERRAGGTSF